MGSVCSKQEFNDFLLRHCDPTATHNCWAYKIDQIYRFNDDGEPTGTAGKPILTAIESENYDNTAALVIRYYGGVKLGTGGLIRAYGKTVREALENAPHEIIHPRILLQCLVHHKFTQKIYYLCNKYNAEINQSQYIVEKALFSISIYEKDKNNFTKQLNELTKGQSSVKIKNIF